MQLFSFFILVFFFIIFFFTNGSNASKGDEEEGFQQCLKECQQEKRDIPLSLRLLFWDQNSNCKYECMQERVKEFRSHKLPISQYYGKWPFIRVFGIQELFSVIFSIMNIMAHYHGYKRFVRRAGRQPLVTLFYLIGMNSWIWSVVFHTRDVKWTERMDYFSAIAVLFYSLYFCMTMTMNFGSLMKKILFIIFFYFYFGHVWYLAMIKFDYAYNMRVMIAIGFIFNLLWFLHGLRNCNSSSHSKWIVVWTLCCTMSATMEVFDFEPIFGLVDAHSIWHGLTAPLTLTFYYLMQLEFQNGIKYSII